MDELRLDVSRLRELRAKMGNPTVRGLCKILGVSETLGYRMFRRGELPEDAARRKVVLRKIADYFGVEVPQILLRLEARRTAS